MGKEPVKAALAPTKWAQKTFSLFRARPGPCKGPGAHQPFGLHSVVSQRLRSKCLLDIQGQRA